MKIVLTGGGSGGHFYPLIAVAEELRSLAKEKNILEMEIFYMASTPYDQKALFENSISFVSIPSGKMRRYFSMQNIVDIFKSFVGIFVALYRLFSIYPDVVFSKGGYPAVPVVLAARVFRIPIIIHESDTIPGRTSLLTARFAQRIAISFKEAYKFFDPKTALVGHLVRKEIRQPIYEGSFEFLKLNPTIPTIFIIGGSQGARLINEQVLNVLPALVEKYQVIHQTGTTHFQEVSTNAEVILENSPSKENYRPFPYLNPLALRMCAGASELIISRGGASSIAEIAWWGVPAIIVPIQDTNGDHQRINAFSYASTGAAIVIEEKNLTSQVFTNEIERILENQTLKDSMKQASQASRYPNSVKDIAGELIAIGFKHEE